MPPTPPEILDRLRERHGLTEADVRRLLKKHPVDGELLGRLLHLACVEYRNLDVWGNRAALKRAAAEAIEEACEKGARGTRP